MAQSALPYPVTPSYLAQDFVVSDSNRAAHEAILQLMQSLSPVIAIIGAAGAGKTHLLHVLKAHYPTLTLDYTTLGHVPADVLMRHHTVLALDDAHHITQAPHSTATTEAALAQCINQVRAANLRLVLFSRIALPRIEVALPDLASRLKAIPAIAIAPPDDALLYALLRKGFSDRQLRVGDEIIHYLLARMERTANAAGEMVARVDAYALAHKRSITLALVRETLNDSVE